MGHLNISLYILPVSETDTYLFIFLFSSSDIPVTFSNIIPGALVPFAG